VPGTSEFFRSQKRVNQIDNQAQRHERTEDKFPRVHSF
jgi:hypothetical protein